MPYYFVRWGETTRCEKAPDRLKACRLAYGLVSENMLVKNIGNRKLTSLSRKVIDQFEKDDVGWTYPNGKHAQWKDCPLCGAKHVLLVPSRWEIPGKHAKGELRFEEHDVPKDPKASDASHRERSRQCRASREFVTDVEEHVKEQNTPSDETTAVPDTPPSQLEKPLRPSVQSPTWGQVQKMAETVIELLGGPKGAADKLNGASFYTLSVLASLNLNEEKAGAYLLGR